MKARTLFTKAATGLGTVALALTLGACSHTNATAGQDYGNMRTEQAAQQQASGETVGTAPAPSNVQGTSGGTGTAAVISGPAKVDDSGRVYTSSSAGGAGNASATGVNTNVNIVPKSNAGTVTVAETPAPLVTEPTQTTVETTPATAPVVETPPPMVSSTTVETPTTTTTQTTRHRRMRKD